MQKYLSVTGHVYSPAYPTAGKAAFAKLGPQIQLVLAQTARDVAGWARLSGAGADESLQSKLAGAGMQVNVADRAAFVEASKPIYKQFAAELQTGQALIDAALALAE